MKNVKNTRGFIDPITLGFLISLLGTTTALTVRNTDNVENVSAAQTQVQAVAAVQIEDDYNF